MYAVNDADDDSLVWSLGVLGEDGVSSKSRVLWYDAHEQLCRMISDSLLHWK